MKKHVISLCEKVPPSTPAQTCSINVIRKSWAHALTSSLLNDCNILLHERESTPEGTKYTERCNQVYNKGANVRLVYFEVCAGSPFVRWSPSKLQHLSTSVCMEFYLNRGCMPSSWVLGRYRLRSEVLIDDLAWNGQTTATRIRTFDASGQKVWHAQPVKLCDPELSIESFRKKLTISLLSYYAKL